MRVFRSAKTSVYISQIGGSSVSIDSHNVTQELPATQKRTATPQELVDEVKTELLKPLETLNQTLLKKLQDPENTLPPLDNVDKETLEGYLDICQTFVNQHGKDYKFPGKQVYVDYEIFRIKRRLDKLRAAT